MRRLAIAYILLGLPVGAAVGLGCFTFIYARGYSYATDDPEACANCHVMRPYLHAWERSSHHGVATCNDCHTPSGAVGKAFAKARSGLHHSLAFTTGNYPDRIRITPYNKAVVEQSCRECHADIVQAIDMPSPGAEPLSCIRCHSTAGHLE